jgi:GrpB-like predicted nucleotidyltransferase (UPF0157 family)
MKPAGGGREMCPEVAIGSSEVGHRLVAPDRCWDRGRSPPFRDWLRTHPEDGDLYAEVEGEVSTRGFTDAMLHNKREGMVHLRPVRERLRR